MSDTEEEKKSLEYERIKKEKKRLNEERRKLHEKTEREREKANKMRIDMKKLQKEIDKKRKELGLEDVDDDDYQALLKVVKLEKSVEILSEHLSAESKARGRVVDINTI